MLPATAISGCPPAAGPATPPVARPSAIGLQTASTGHKLRKDYSDGDPDWESDFFILKNTLCAAALTENLFHDNSDDCLFLESDEGRRAIVALHVEGIVNYVYNYFSPSNSIL